MKQKKSLGQNFLKSKEVINKIIETADLSENDVVLEIGPGKGVLTEKILEKAGKVIVIEKDDRLIGFLEEKFSEDIEKGKLKIIHDDILDFDINLWRQSFLKENNNSEILKYKVVANIPYYITGQIIRKFLSSETQPEKMVLMVQKEVAKRIVDEVGSLLSMSVKVYGEPKYIKTVKAKYFSPPPKVDSAVLLIDNISKDFFKSLRHPMSKLSNEKNEKDFFNLIKAGFSHKRKVLINNLKTDWDFVENLSKDEIGDMFEKANIPLKARAENLSKKDWGNILDSSK